VRLVSRETVLVHLEEACTHFCAQQTLHK